MAARRITESVSSHKSLPIGTGATLSLRLVSYRCAVLSGVLMSLRNILRSKTNQRDEPISAKNIMSKEKPSLTNNDQHCLYLMTETNQWSLSSRNRYYDRYPTKGSIIPDTVPIRKSLRGWYIP